MSEPSILLRIKEIWKPVYRVNKSLWPLSAAAAKPVAAYETVPKIKSRRYTGMIELVGYITQLHKFVLSYIVVASIIMVVTFSIVNEMGPCVSSFRFTEVR